MSVSALLAGLCRSYVGWQAESDRMTINRVVALLTPVFAALAGWIAQVAAQYLPGHPSLNAGELTAVFVAGAAAALAAAYKWLQGWQKHEQAQLYEKTLKAQTTNDPRPLGK